MLFCDTNRLGVKTIICFLVGIENLIKDKLQNIEHVMTIKGLLVIKNVELKWLATTETMEHLFLELMYVPHIDTEISL